jgi:hypothetical protein
LLVALVDRNGTGGGATVGGGATLGSAAMLGCTGATLGSVAVLAGGDATLGSVLGVALGLVNSFMELEQCFTIGCVLRREDAVFHCTLDGGAEVLNGCM